MFENEKEYKSYIDGMDRYIEELKRMRKENPEEARKRARRSLIDSGVLDKNGNPKKRICN